MSDSARRDAELARSRSRRSLLALRCSPPRPALAYTIYLKDGIKDRRREKYKIAGRAAIVDAAERHRDRRCRSAEIDVERTERGATWRTWAPRW